MCVLVTVFHLLLDACVAVAMVRMRASQSICRSIALLLCFCLFVFGVDTSKYSKSITLSYEFISSAPQSVKPLCTLFYDPKTLRYTLYSWTPPSTDDPKSRTPEPTSAPLLRILLPNGSSTVTSLSTFSDHLNQHVSLWLSSEPDGSIFSASVTSTTPAPLSPEEEKLQKKIERAKARGKPLPSAAKPKPKKKSKKDQTPTKEAETKDAGAGPKVKVTLIPAKSGPTPKLGSRAPPQVDTEGNEIPQQEEQEKSFFQRYWWVLAIAAVLTLGMGGGEK